MDKGRGFPKITKLERTCQADAAFTLLTLSCERTGRGTTKFPATTLQGNRLDTYCNQLMTCNKECLMFKTKAEGYGKPGVLSQIADELEVLDCRGHGVICDIKSKEYRHCLSCIYTILGSDCHM